MSFLKLIFIILLFYLFALLNSSFLIPFSVHGVVPNLILVFIITLLFTEKQIHSMDLLIVLIGGFFLDIFSTAYFGILTLDLFILFLIFKFVFKALSERNILSFILTLAVSVLFYDLFYSFFNWVIASSFQLRSAKVSIVEILYDLLIGLIFYFIFVLIDRKRSSKIINKYHVFS